eukprot:TRINITY_DN41579_c0_g1_i1.p1 TRINITY_DN41579_c0_g1~~TRINITY_DN41579_c0_g1_i1.p1  ORF type:complete len:304 (-),score=39.51 TRINITY_DN41579_c0_g1_i1:155-1066(-)
MTSLARKLAIVTGGSTGIGRATAQRLVSRGANVVITGRRTDAGRKAEEDCNANFAADGAKCLFLQGDAANPESVQEIMAKAKATFGPLSFLFNNAGVEGAGLLPFENQSLETISQVINVNVLGVLYFARLALPEMVENGGGVIVNNSSMAATMNRSFSSPEAGAAFAPYSASKIAVDQVTRILSTPYLQKNIKIYSVNPLAIKTEMTDRFVDQLPEGVGGADFLASFNPSGTVGTPEAIADVVMAMFDGSTKYQSGDCVLSESGHTWDAKVLYDHICDPLVTDPSQIVMPKTADALDFKGEKP